MRRTPGRRTAKRDNSRRALCPQLPDSYHVPPAGKNGLTVSYQEPTTSQNGVLLTDLAYTTIYLSSRKAQTKAMRIWTNDAHGGALVTIRNISVPAQEPGLCVTATTWGRTESGPAPLAQAKP